MEADVRAVQQPVGPNSKIFHCVANTIGESPDGKQTSSGSSFIREPNGIPLAEAGFYQEEMITAVLDMSRADRALHSRQHEIPTVSGQVLAGNGQGRAGEGELETRINDSRPACLVGPRQGRRHLLRWETTLENQAMNERGMKFRIGVMVLGTVLAAVS